ncbi:MAG: hypothetical protein ACSW8I_07865 [bacterium]
MNRYLKLATALLLFAAVAVSCEKEKEKWERQFNFAATIENVVLDSTDRSKVMLVDEQWINWEVGDLITIGSDQTDGSKQYDAYLVKTNIDGGDFSAAFASSLPEESQYFLGLFPHRANNRISGSVDNSAFTARIDLPAAQTVRNDNTFARNVFPMVAWYGGNEYLDPESDFPYNLDFHSLAGIVRLQLFNSSGSDKEISTITLASRDGKQLVGLFDVRNYNTNDPYLSPADNDVANQTLTISCGEGLEFNRNTLRTFYVVMPALGGRLVSTNYQLTMTVTTTDGGTCSRNVTVPVRRTGITNIRALGINAWTGSGSFAGLAGNGTEERPFKVYTFTDLVYLRNAYNSNPQYINGQKVTRNTYIRIMRSDIEIPDGAYWSAGIQNFCGHITTVSNNSNPGITTHNNSVPLFESITDSGVVEEVILKANVNYMGNTAFSPFCHTNKGELRNCVVNNVTGESSAINSNYANMAALCVENYGIIDACRCDATLQAAGYVVGGLCLHNNSTGTIKRCQITSPMNVRAATQIGGVCHNNEGTVKDCYFSATITQSSSAWGGIVYTNSGTVEHCANMGIITTNNTVGGVVNTVTGGKVDYCYCEAQLRGNMVGGVACAVEGGKVINSFINHSGVQIFLNASASEHCAGGIAATLSGGSIQNCFVHFPHIDMYDLTGHIGGIVGHATGGSIGHCYSYETTVGTHYFYGVSTTATYDGYCYLVDDAKVCHLVSESSQNGSTDINNEPSQVFALIQANLNLEPPDGAKAWTGASGNTTPPHLAAYSPAKRRR